MPAADEFPRGVTLINFNFSAGQATVTFPASPGISWVITDIIGKLTNSSAAGYSAQIQDNYGRTFLIFIVNVGSTTATVDSASWAGKVTYPPGIGPAFNVNVGISSGWEHLTVIGYPI